jgi:hypothetical protein
VPAHQKPGRRARCRQGANTAMTMEHSTRLTVALLADGAHDAVHGPAIQVLIRHNLQWNAVHLAISLHGLQRRRERWARASSRRQDNDGNTHPTSKESSL